MHSLAKDAGLSNLEIGLISGGVVVAIFLVVVAVVTAVKIST